MSDLEAITRDLYEIGIRIGVPDLAKTVAELPNGRDRLTASIAKAKQDRTVKSVPAVISQQIKSNRLMDLDDPKVYAMVKRSADVESMSHEERRRMFKALDLACWNEENAVHRDPVGTKYFRASDAMKGITDPPPWAVKGEGGLEILIGPREKGGEGGGESGFFIKGTDRWYTHRFPRSVRESELRRQAQLIRSQA